LSTRREVTDTSGRGVVLSAVRVACDALGGTIDVETISGRGTAFTFRFTLENTAHATAQPRCAARDDGREPIFGHGDVMGPANNTA